MGNLLYALQVERGTLSDRVHTIMVCLGKKSEAIKIPYTGADLEAARDRLAEVEVAIAAISLHRKCKPIYGIEFKKIIKVRELRAALSHPEDQDKKLWVYDQQKCAFDNIVGLTQSTYEGKPTINLLINVLPDAKK